MTFLELRQRIAEMLALDQTDTEIDTSLQEWVNDSYRLISGIQRWPWLVTNDVIQTVPDITTGTVSITQDSAAIVFSSAPTVSVANDYRIQFDDSDDWYDISSHTASSVNATLADPFLGTTDGTASYTLRKVYYTLPSNFDRMTTVRQARTDIKVEPIDFRLKDKILPDPTETGEPRFYEVIGQDPAASASSQPQYRLVFFPTPNVEMNVDMRFYKQITDLSADTDVPIFPPQWHSVIIFDVLDRYGYTFLDDDRKNEVRTVKNELLDQMIKNRNPIPDKLVSKMQWDKVVRIVNESFLRRVQLPVTEV